VLFISVGPVTIELDDENKRLDEKESKRETRRLTAHFIPGGDVPPHARDLATQLPGFYRGIGRDEDPYKRLSWYDTVYEQAQHGWTDETREFIENQLLRLGGADVMLVEEARVPAPYANYDKHRKTQGKRTLDHVFTDIRTVYDTAGFDPGTAVAYERQNLNDAKVIEFLSSLAVSDEVAGETEELVAA
jgi:hypothetical protein